MSADPSRLDRLSPERRALLAKRLSALSAGGAGGGAGAGGAGVAAEPAAPHAAAPSGSGEPLARRAATPAGGGEPLSPAQMRLWRVSQGEPRRALYNLFHAVRLAGPLRRPALAAALATVTARHEALRTRFVETTAGPEARVDPAPGTGPAPETEPAPGIASELGAIPGPAGLPLPLVDLAALAEARARRAAERALGELAERRFDLARGPLLRAVLLRFSPAEHALLLIVHHIAIDAWSLTILVREMAAAYAAHAAGQARRELPPAFQAGDFTAWQARRLRAGALDAEVGWWRQRLAGAAPEGMAWPPRGRAAAAAAAGGRASLVLDAAQAAPLRELARRQRVTLFVAALAAWKTLLHLRGGERDVTVGTVMAWRERPEAAGLVGLLLNLLVLRTDLGGDPTFAELLGRVRETAFEAFAHPQAPFEHLAAQLLPEPAAATVGAAAAAAAAAGADHRPATSAAPATPPTPSAPPTTPWIRGVVNMPLGEATHAAPLAAAGLEISPVLTGETGSELDWTLHAREQDGGIRFDFGHAPGLFAPGEAAALLDELGALLAAAAADPRRRLSQLSPPMLAGVAEVAGPTAHAGAAEIAGRRLLEA